MIDPAAERAAREQERRARVLRHAATLDLFDEGARKALRECAGLCEHRARLLRLGARRWSPETAGLH